MLGDLNEQRDNYLKLIESYAVVDGEKTYTIDNPVILSVEKATEIRDYVAGRYLDGEQKPFIMPYGQCLIFYCIAYRAFPYAQLLTQTQYGKSDAVSISVLERVSNFPEEWIITAPSGNKADIIMRKLTSHIFDNEYTKNKFVYEKGETEDRILHSKGKSHITFRMISGGGVGRVRTVSVDSKNQRQGIEAAMGEGAANVISDESALLSDQQESGIFRMLNGYADSCYIKIGNPFNRNHFMRSWRDDPDYKQVFVPWQQAQVEGRITIDKVQKAKAKPNFGVLFDCLFPGEDSQDDAGFNPLVKESSLERCFVESIVPQTQSIIYSVDIAGGGSNFSVITSRTAFGIKKRWKGSTDDMFEVYAHLDRIIREDEPKVYRIIVDSIGIGKGFYDICRQFHLEKALPFVGGENQTMTEAERSIYVNQRARCHWRLKQYIEAGGKIVADDDWQEILVNKYKVQADKKIIIKSKEQLKKDGIESPDVSDTAMMTFFIDLPDIDDHYHEEDVKTLSQETRQINTLAAY